jgi:hypothetical protein
MVHLIAELLDNATAFSPPDSAVVVEARRVGDRAVLLIEDRGIGVSPDQLQELNERLANPPMVDVAVSRMMGLVVVARLGARHGVKVELRPARERGTIADVTLPSGVLVPRALAGRPAAGTPIAGGPIAGGRESVLDRPAPTPPPRTAFQPLALESGPSAGPRDFAGTGNGLAAGPPAAWGDFSTPTTGGLGAALSATSGPGGGQPPRGPSALGGPPAPRGLPAWSDLTGVNGSDLHPPTVRPGTGEPLPQRRSGDHWTPETLPESPFTPRTRPSALDPQPEPPAEPEPPTAAVPPAPVPLVPAPIAPPAWPPVAPTPEPQTGPEPTDSTAEIPRVRLDWDTDEATADATYHDVTAFSADSMVGGSAAETRPQPFADETMELPIFRELESAWFRTRGSEPVEPVSPAPYNGTGAGTGTQVHGPVEVEYEDYYAHQEEPAQPVSVGAAATSRPIEVEVEPDWHTPADEGWRAASALAAQQEFLVTDTGLPKRVPMSQLVPGGVERGAQAANRRTPEAVRGLLSAYHRGVQRGRSQRTGSDPNTAEPTTTGPQNSQAGKEQEA